jgi:hypothetical protein
VSERKLDIGTVTINATQTRCTGCQFEHDNSNACTLFYVALEKTEPTKGMDYSWEYGHKRAKECVIAEWRAKKRLKDANNGT